MMRALMVLALVEFAAILWLFRRAYQWFRAFHEMAELKASVHATCDDYHKLCGDWKRINDEIKEENRKLRAENRELKARRATRGGRHPEGVN